MPNFVVVAPDIAVDRLVKKRAAERPLTKDRVLLAENRIWAEQFRAGSPGSRSMVTCKINGAIETDFVKSMSSAAQAAGSGGTVILFTGHGSRDPREDPTSKFGFETIPEADKPKKTERITADHLDFTTIAERDAKGKWSPKPQKRGNVIYREDQQIINDLARGWDVLQSMKSAFSTNGVEWLILLTCNVGNYPIQCRKLASILGVKIIAYTKLISTTEIVPPLEDDMGQRWRSVVIWPTRDRTEKHPPLDSFLKLVFVGANTPDEIKRVKRDWKNDWRWSMYPAIDLERFDP